MSINTPEQGFTSKLMWFLYNMQQRMGRFFLIRRNESHLRLGLVFGPIFNVPGEEWPPSSVQLMRLYWVLVRRVGRVAVIGESKGARGVVAVGVRTEESWVAVKLEEIIDLAEGKVKHVGSGLRKQLLGLGTCLERNIKEYVFINLLLQSLCIYS